MSEISQKEVIPGVSACCAHHQKDLKVDESVCAGLQEVIQAFHHQGVDISFIPTGGIRGIVLVQGEVSAAVTDSNSIYEGRPLMEVMP